MAAGARTLSSPLLPFIKDKAMPQSTKDSKGGKTSSTKTTHSKGHTSEASAKKNSGRSANSPTGPQTHGEKKTTP